MEEKKQIKISLGTAVCLFIIAILAVMCIFLYMQKNETNSNANELKDNQGQNQETTNSDKIPEVENTTDKTSDSKVDEIAKELFEKGSQKIRETGYTDYYQYESAQPLTEKNINGVTYQKRNVLYANIEKEYSEIFAEDALKNVLSKRFAEVDGYLYVSYGGATGWDVTNVKVTRVSGNNNEIKYKVTYNDVSISDAISEQKSCEMTVKLVNGKYRISNTNYLSIK